MAQTIPTGTFGVAKWVVSADATQGTHTTVASAMTSASSGDVIWIRGNFTENVTLKAGVIISGAGWGTASASISGTLTMSAAGTALIQNISLGTNGANPIAQVTGSASSAIVFKNCFLNCSSNTGLVNNSSGVGSGIEVIDCFYDTAAGNALFTNTQGTLLIQRTGSDQTLAASSTANSSAAGTVFIEHSYLTNGLSVTGGTANISHSTFDQSGVNTTALTNNGGTVNSFHNHYLAGTASGITATSGTINSFNDNVDSSNTNAVTGAGTFNYSGIVFGGSSSLINTTTQTGGTYKGVQTSTVPAAGFIGEVLTLAQGTPQALSNATVVNIVNGLNITAGTWAIFGMAVFAATGMNTTNVEIVAALQTVNNSVSSLDTFASAALSGVGLQNYNGAQSNILLGPYVVNLAATTTYYLNVELVAAVSANMNATGRIRAIRIA